MMTATSYGLDTRGADVTDENRAPVVFMADGTKIVSAWLLISGDVVDGAVVKSAPCDAYGNVSVTYRDGDTGTYRADQAVRVSDNVGD